MATPVLKVLRGSAIDEAELAVLDLEDQMAELRAAIRRARSWPDCEAALREHHALAVRRMEILEAAARA